VKTWPRHPVIYEINTWVWLGDLGRKYRRIVDLATVPAQEWDAIASLGVDAVWFMGVCKHPAEGSGTRANRFRPQGWDRKDLKGTC
jgi:hypothetical protein